MALTKLYSAEDSGQMMVAGFMSGSGTNLVKILEHELELARDRGMSPYHVAVIFSDTHKSKAREIGARFGVPVFVYDLEGFCAKRGTQIKDMDARADYETRCMRVLQQFDCKVAAYAGYMRKATDVFVNSFLGVNVHPADLTILGLDGRPKYRGDHAVLDALLAGEKTICSTTHLVAKDVDCGRVLMVSAPLKVKLVNADDAARMAEAYQSVLKEKGDWIIFPRTLEYLADGRFARDELGKLYLIEKIPNGVRLN